MCLNTFGAVTGLAVGLASSIALILVGPSVMAIDLPNITGSTRHLIQHSPLFPLENPGIGSIPLGFLGALLGTFVGRREPIAEHKFTELQVRANLGIGSEKASTH